MSYHDQHMFDFGSPCGFTMRGSKDFIIRADRRLCPTSTGLLPRQPVYACGW